MSLPLALEGAHCEWIGKLVKHGTLTLLYALARCTMVPYIHRKQSEYPSDYNGLRSNGTWASEGRIHCHEDTHCDWIGKKVRLGVLTGLYAAATIRWTLVYFGVFFFFTFT